MHARALPPQPQYYSPSRSHPNNVAGLLPLQRAGVVAGAPLPLLRRWRWRHAAAASPSPSPPAPPSPPPRLSPQQQAAVDDPAQHRVVWAVAGSGKTETLVQAALRELYGGGGGNGSKGGGGGINPQPPKNVLVLTKISSVTEEVLSRLTRDRPELRFERKGKSHWIAQAAPSSLPPPSSSSRPSATTPATTTRHQQFIEVANFDAAVHANLALGAGKRAVAMARGDSFRLKTRLLVGAILRGEAPPVPLLANGAPASLLLVDEAQDLEADQVELLRAWARGSGLAASGGGQERGLLRTLLVGDPLQTVFDRSVQPCPSEEEAGQETGRLSSSSSSSSLTPSQGRRRPLLHAGAGGAAGARRGAAVVAATAAAPAPAAAAFTSSSSAAASATTPLPVVVVAGGSVPQPRGRHALDAWADALPHPGPSRHDMAVCHRCPPSHLRLVNAVMRPLQRQYGAPSLLAPTWVSPPPPSPSSLSGDNHDSSDTVPFFFAHPYGRDNTTASVVAAQAAAIVESWMAHDSSLQPEDVAVLATTTNQNAVFAQLQPLLCSLYNRLGFQTPDAAVHFRTKDDVGTLTIDWRAAEGRTPMVSVHGEKGRGHRAVLLLDASSGALPARHRAGRAEALVDASLLNVALTRSTRYLAVGFRNGHPSAYLAARVRLDSDDPGVAGTAAAAATGAEEEEEEDDGFGGDSKGRRRLAWCAWALPPPHGSSSDGDNHPQQQPSPLHRALARAVLAVPGAPRAFSPPLTLLPERSEHPVKRLVAVSVDAAHAPEFEHPSQIVAGWSPGGGGGSAAPSSSLSPGLEAAAAAAFPFDDHLRYAAAVRRARPWTAAPSAASSPSSFEEEGGDNSDDDNAPALPSFPPVPLRRERFGRPFALFRDAASRSRHAELAPVTGRLAELLLERIVKHDGAFFGGGGGGGGAGAANANHNKTSPLAPSYAYLLEHDRHALTDDELALNLSADADLNRLARAANHRLDAWRQASGGGGGGNGGEDDEASPSSSSSSSLESDARRAVDAWLQAAAEAEARAREMGGGGPRGKASAAGAAAAALLAAVQQQVLGSAVVAADPPSSQTKKKKAKKKTDEDDPSTPSLPAHIPYVLPSFVRSLALRRGVEAFLCPRTPTRDLKPSSLWTLALAVALLHAEARRPALLRYFGEEEEEEEEERGLSVGKRGGGKKAAARRTPVRPEAYARLLANVEGLAALLAREHHHQGGQDTPSPLLSFEDDHSLRCTFALDSPGDATLALLGVGARSDVVVDDFGAALRSGEAMLAETSALPAPGFLSSSSSAPPSSSSSSSSSSSCSLLPSGPFRRLLEIKCPAGGTATDSSSNSPSSSPLPPTCANVWWNQALLYAALSKKPVHLVSVADVAAGVLYTAPVALAPRDRTLALKKVLRAFRFPEGAQEMLAGLLRARIEAGRIEDGGLEEEEDDGGEEEGKRRRKARKQSSSPPRFFGRSGVAPGGGWELDGGLAESEALDESRCRRRKGEKAAKATTTTPRRRRATKATAAAG